MMKDTLKLKMQLSEFRKYNDFKKNSGILCKENRLEAYRSVSQYRDMNSYFLII